MLTTNKLQSAVRIALGMSAGAFAVTIAPSALAQDSGAEGVEPIDEIVTMIAKQQGRVVKPDQFSDKGYFYRSDQFSFAKIGVPAMYLDTGTDFIDRPPEWGREQQNHYTEVNYHQPTNTIPPGILTV